MKNEAEHKPAFFSGDWFAQNLAVVLVVANGLVISIIAFVALRVYTADLQLLEMERIAQRAAVPVQEKIIDFEQTTSALSALLSLAENVHESNLRAFLSRVKAHGDQVESVIWARPVDNWYQVGLVVSDQPQSLRPGMPLPRNRDIERASLPKNANRLVAVSRMDKMTSSKPENAIFADEKPFALAINIPPRRGYSGGMLIVTTYFSRLLESGWEFERSRLGTISVDTDLAGHTVLNESMNISGSIAHAIVSPAQKSQLLNIGDSVWRMQVMVPPSQAAIMLGLVPWGMLGFGMAMTSVFGFYMFRNQRQATLLTEMAETLEGANAQLNQQMKERDTLYESLQQTEQEFRAVVNAINDIIFEADSNGNLLFLNDRWLTVTGIEPSTVMGDNLTALLHPEDRERVKLKLEALTYGKIPSFRENARLERLDGAYREIELSVSHLKSEGQEGGPMRIVGIIIDVEERRAAEQALMETEMKYRSIVENSINGFYQIDTEGYIIGANQSLADILGYATPDELTSGIKAVDVYHSNEQHAAFVQEVIEKGMVKGCETLVNRKDGTTTWININARTVWGSDGRIKYYEGTVEEIAQRKQAEMALVDAKQQSDLAYRAKSEFLANMSHELRTPLNAIIGFAEIIKNEMLGPVGQKAYWEYSNDIYESGIYLLEVINEILDVSKIDAGKRELNESEVNINKVIESCLKLAGPRAQSADLTVENQIAEDFPMIIAEELALKQILLNLINNSVKFTPEGGHIYINADVTPQHEIMIRVTDTGVGIAPDDLEKAVSPFGQLDTSLNRSGSGTGLGLTLVKSLVELHGGNFRLESAVGEGTTATIIFKADRLAQKPPQATEPPAAQSHS